VTEPDVAAYVAAIDVPLRPTDRLDGIWPTPRYTRVERRAQEFAQADGSTHVRSEHFVLGMIWEDGLNGFITPPLLQASLAQLGVTVPRSDPPTTAEYGESFNVSAKELPELLDRLLPLLAPPEITVGVRREGNRAWICAAKSIDLRGQIEQMRTEP